MKPLRFLATVLLTAIVCLLLLPAGTEYRHG